MIVIIRITLCNPTKKVIQVVMATSEYDDKVLSLKKLGYTEVIGIYDISSAKK